MVSGDYHGLSVNINISFPLHYPSAPPDIKFVHPTKISSKLQTALSKVCLLIKNILILLEILI